MNFGFGDAVTVAKLAQQVYTQCKSAPGDFQVASTQANSVSIVLNEINDSWAEMPGTAEQERRLKPLCKNCSLVLEDLNETLSQYHSLGTDAPGKRDRLLWDKDKAQHARQQLQEQLIVLNTFKTSLISSSQGQILAGQTQIERKLDKVLLDIQNGVKNSEGITAALDYSKDEQTRMTQLAQTLKEYDISSKELGENKAFIDTFLQSAFAQGRLEVKVEHSSRIAPGNPMRTQPPNNMVLSTTMPQRRHSRLIPLAFIPGTICFWSSMETALSKSDHDKLAKDIAANNLVGARKRMQQGASARWLETQGFHSLHLVAKEGWIEMARLLVSSGMPVNVQTADGKRPVHVACAHGNVEIVELFIQDDPTQVHVCDYQGETPLHAACTTRAGRTVRLVRRLLHSGVEIDTRSDANETPLLLLFRYLCVPDPDPEIETDRAWRKPDRDVVQLLLQKGAATDTRNDDGHDVWHYLNSLPDAEVSQVLSTYSRRR